MSKRQSRGDKVVAVATEVEADEQEAPPEVTPSVSVFASEPEAAEDDTDPKAPRPKLQPPRETKVLREIRDDEDRSLRDWLSSIGTAGAFKVQVIRKEPQTVRINGKEVKASGHLQTFDRPIDEEFIQREYGGGSYYLKVTRKTADGSYRFQPGYHRTLEIAGAPVLDRLPGYEPAAATPQAAGGPADGSMKLALDVLKDQLGKPQQLDPGIQLLLEQMRDQAAALQADNAALRREASAAAATAAKGHDDPVKDKMLSNLLDGQSGHVQALQARYESELRQVREQAQATEERLRDRHERDSAAAQTRHEREMDMMRTAHDREIMALRQSYEVASSSTKASHELQAQLFVNDIQRQQRDIDRLQREVDSLREKKDKPLPEQLKELKDLKELINDGEDGAKSGWDRIGELVTNPALIEGIHGIIASRKAPPTPAAPPQPTPAKNQIVRMNGEFFKHVVDDAGNATLVPVKKKPAVVTADDGQKIEAPQVDEAQVATVVGYLEKAYANHQAPEIVAQSGRALVPEPIMTWIRDHDTDTTSGVDLFVSKVAKLPASSPLGTLGGRNWLKKVGKALIGSE